MFPPSPTARPGDGLSILELDSLKMGKSMLYAFHAAGSIVHCLGEVEIPRQSRIGYSDNDLSRRPQRYVQEMHTGSISLSRARSLASLLPQHQISLVDLRTHQEEPRPLENTDDITIASSMLGQPPSKFDADDERNPYTDDLESYLRAIWSKAGCDEFGIILRDGIDESKVLLFEGEGVSYNQLPSS